MTTNTSVQQPGTFQVRLIDRIAHWPWWLIVIVFVGVLIFALSGMIGMDLLTKVERRFDKWRPQVGAAE